MSCIKSTCPYCGVGCGVKIDDSRQTPLVLGDESHPANFGKLCSKGSALGDTLAESGSAPRLTNPTVNGRDVSWQNATQEIADRISQSIAEHGRESVAFYLSGQLLTEDYYVANKLMKGYIGTANVDTNSRLCMSSAVAAYKRAFGMDSVPCSYEDIDKADLIVLIGSNAAWTHPVLYQRMVAAKQARPSMKIVLIDPRETATADCVDLHLPVKPSSDGFLFNGLLKHLIDHNILDQTFIDDSTQGFAELLLSLNEYSIAKVAQDTGLSETDLTTFYRLFADTKKVVSFYSMGINQSATGTDKCNAIINCHLATGRIGKEGAGPFSITGQPNAMGGREVGGLSNQLAAHMDFAEADVDRVQRFWNSPIIANKPGLKAVDLFTAMDAGKIKVVWIMATNPAVSLPDSENVRRALQKCPTVIVSDVTNTDTTALANIVLPAQAWSEKDGTVTNSERRISRQRRFFTAPDEAKADWQAMSEVAQKMGFTEGFNYPSAYDIFIEHAALSGFENNGNRDFDISALQNLSAQEYDSFEPKQWPINQAAPNGTERLFTDAQFFTANKRANFVVTHAQLAECLTSDNDNVTDKRLLFNTGRLRDQWHTMTRTGHVAKLSAHDDLPFIELHPDDASANDIHNLEMVRVSNDYGEMIGQAKISPNIPVKTVFSPIHWSNEFAHKSVVTAVVSPEVDPISGQPQLKATAVTLEKLPHYQWARIASTTAIDKHGFDYWAQTKTARGFVTLVGVKTSVDGDVFNWHSWLNLSTDPKHKIMSFAQARSAQGAWLVTLEDNLDLMIFASSTMTDLPSYAWLAKSFDDNQVDALASLIRSESGEADSRVCSCFGTSQKTIQASINAGAKDVYELGTQLGCGSKCGSCKPELSALLKDHYRRLQKTA